MDLKCYIFNTLTGEGTMFGKDNVYREPLSTPHSASEILDNGNLKIWSDDGNESSYGFDIFEFTADGFVKLVESRGRDCFDNNISDNYDWDYENVSTFVPISVDEFDAMFKNHIQKFEYFTANPRG